MNRDTHCGLALSPKAIMDRDKIELDIHKIDLIPKKLHVMKETTVGRASWPKNMTKLGWRDCWSKTERQFHPLARLFHCGLALMGKEHFSGIFYRRCLQGT